MQTINRCSQIILTEKLVTNDVKDRKFKDWNSFIIHNQYCSNLYVFISILVIIQ